MRFETRQRINRLGMPVTQLRLWKERFEPIPEPDLQSEIDAKTLPVIDTECAYGIAQECPFASNEFEKGTNADHRYCIGCAFWESRNHGIDRDRLKRRLSDLGYRGPKTLSMCITPVYRVRSCMADLFDREKGCVPQHPVTKIVKLYAVEMGPGVQLVLRDDFDPSDLQPGDLEEQER